MTLTQMQYFATVCQLQNISMAAKVLYISQPALSAALSDLEREVGFKLFNRKSKGVYPTEEGLLFLDHVLAVLKRYNLLKREIPLISLNQNIIKVGFRPFAGENDFFRIYKDFEQEHKDIILRVNEMSNNSPSIYLDEGLIDFLIAPRARVPEDWITRYEFHQIGVEDMQLYCHVDCPLASHQTITLKDISEYPFVFWEGHTSLIENLTEILAQEGLTLNIAAVLPQLTGLLQFICNNLAVGFLTGDFLKYISIIQELPLPTKDGENILAPSVNVYAFWKKEIEKFKNKKLFIDYIRSL
jgi:DNA-binding transcriptional LysR family regulator